MTLTCISSPHYDLQQETKIRLLFLALMYLVQGVLDSSIAILSTWLTRSSLNVSSIKLLKFHQADTLADFLFEFSRYSGRQNLPRRARYVASEEIEWSLVASRGFPSMLSSA